mmetsp:Transcript_91449/g.158530  ORF Transcript_91449/g.158530 Transcript_91449/m.158530 type:complete len:248 (+) Transcript_91449:1-744(+)
MSRGLFWWTLWWGTEVCTSNPARGGSGGGGLRKAALWAGALVLVGIAWPSNGIRALVSPHGFARTERWLEADRCAGFGSPIGPKGPLRTPAGQPRGRPEGGGGLEEGGRDGRERRPEIVLQLHQRDHASGVLGQLSGPSWAGRLLQGGLVMHPSQRRPGWGFGIPGRQEACGLGMAGGDGCEEAALGPVHRAQQRPGLQFAGRVQGVAPQAVVQLRRRRIYAVGIVHGRVIQLVQGVDSTAEAPLAK